MIECSTFDERSIWGEFRKVKKTYGTLRYGQWFLNTYYPSVSDPELFYERNEDICSKIIKDRYTSKGE